jgi:iron-sulfur cluster assembly protein
MLTMTDNAAQAVRLLSRGSGGLRITAGTPTSEGTPLEIGLAPEAQPNDQTVEEAGACVFMEEDVAAALDDMVLDAAVEGEQVRFALRDAAPDADA